MLSGTEVLPPCTVVAANESGAIVIDGAATLSVADAFAVAWKKPVEVQVIPDSGSTTGAWKSSERHGPPKPSRTSDWKPTVASPPKSHPGCCGFSKVVSRYWNEMSWVVSSRITSKVTLPGSFAPPS